MKKLEIDTEKKIFLLDGKDIGNRSTAIDIHIEADSSKNTVAITYSAVEVQAECESIVIKE